MCLFYPHLGKIRFSEQIIQCNLCIQHAVMLVVQHAKGCNHGELGAVAGRWLFTEDGHAVAQVHFVGFVDDVGRAFIP